jgi:hypothetical protein
MLIVGVAIRVNLIRLNKIWQNVFNVICRFFLLSAARGVAYYMPKIFSTILLIIYIAVCNSIFY